MCYRCSFCGVVVRVSPAIRRITKIRTVRYVTRSRESKGWEIVNEILLCPECNKGFKDKLTVSEEKIVAAKALKL